MKRVAVAAGVRRRIPPHQLRHAHAVEMAREGVPLNVIQRQLGHANLDITSIYLEGIDNSEIINTVYAHPAPMLPASAGLRLIVVVQTGSAGRAGRRSRQPSSNDDRDPCAGPELGCSEARVGPPEVTNRIWSALPFSWPALNGCEVVLPLL